MPDLELFGGVIDGVSSDIVICVVAFAVVCLQFFCCWKWGNLLIRLLPAITCVGAIVTFFILMTRVAEGFEALGYLVYMILSAIMLGAVVVGWLVWLVFCIAHNRVGSNPDGY